MKLAKQKTKLFCWSRKQQAWVWYFHGSRA